MEAVLDIFVGALAFMCVIFCVLRPRYAIVPVLMLFPAEQILMGYLPELRFKYGWAVNVVVGIIAVCGVSYTFFKGSGLFQGTKNGVCIAFLFFYSYILVSFLWTPSPTSALYFLGSGWPYFVLLFLVSPLLVKDLDDLVKLNTPLILAGAVLMGLMLINPRAHFIDDRFTVDLGYVPGLGEIRSSPLAIADAGGVLAIMAGLYRPAKRSLHITILQWAGVLLGLTLALLSGSRGQVVAAVGLIAVLAPFVAGIKNVVRVVSSTVIVGGIVGFLYYVFTTFVTSYAQTRWTEHGSAEGLNIRMEMALSALGTYATRPAFWLTGMGAAAFNDYFPIRDPNSPHWYPHNIVIEALTEYGIPGIFLFGTILYLTVRNLMRLARIAGTDRSKRSTVYIYAGITFFHLLMSLKQGALLGMPPYFMFCLILGRVTRNEETAAAAAYAEAVENGTIVEGQEENTEDEWAPAPEPA